MSELDRLSYPGLTDTSAALWRQWLKLYETRFTDFEYNVRVGQGLKPPVGVDPAIAQMWVQLTQKRIDALAHRPGETWLIELNERPGNREAGNLQVYQYLLPRYKQINQKLFLALICRYLGFDMFGYFKSAGVLIFKFQPGKPPSVPPTFLPTMAGTPFVPQ